MKKRTAINIFFYLLLASLVIVNYSCSPSQEPEQPEEQISAQKEETPEPTKAEPTTKPTEEQEEETQTSQSEKTLKENEIVVQLPELPDGATPLIMVKIPAGTFQMGSPESEKFHEKNESPVHKVTITEDFYLGKYEVTQAQWLTLMDKNPSTYEGDNLPVNRVSWHDAQEFIKKLNNLEDHSGFRLPTEAEREYACRAGTTTATYIGENVSMEQMQEHAWFRENSEHELHPVGQKKPNPWGLYDMYGNVWEWCFDWYGLYPKEPQTDPKGPENGEEKVFRGASWLGKFEYMRSADRGKFDPSLRRNTGGLRLAKSIESATN